MLPGTTFGSLRGKNSQGSNLSSVRKPTKGVEKNNPQLDTIIKDFDEFIGFFQNKPQ
jgi:hypothetical protein